MSEGNMWGRLERWMESPAAFYSAFAIMAAICVGVLIYWFGFYAK